MPPIDAAMLVNWIVSGVIGLAFGVAGTWYAHRLTRERDDKRWSLQVQWELEKLRKEHENAVHRMEIEWRERDAHLEAQRLENQQKLLADERRRIREELTKGLDRAGSEIDRLVKFSNWLERDFASEKEFLGRVIKAKRYSHQYQLPLDHGPGLLEALSSVKEFSKSISNAYKYIAYLVHQATDNSRESHDDVGT